MASPSSQSPCLSRPEGDNLRAGPARPLSLPVCSRPMCASARATGQPPPILQRIQDRMHRFTAPASMRLLLELRQHVTHLPPGTVIHLIATDPAAPLDLAAGCHLTGHAYLGPVAGGGALPSYAIW